MRDLSSLKQKLASAVRSVDYARLKDREQGSVLLDVRTDAEWESGHIPQAKHIDRGFLELQIEQLVPDRQTEITCYCASGTRSLFAAWTLVEMGYANVTSLEGGIDGWVQSGGDMVIPANLNAAQKERYARQISIPEVGAEGQVKLGESKVLIVGAGGLGCPIGLYLAASGVGKIDLVDDDLVSISNLHRQILYSAASIGKPKVEVARQELIARNPDLKCEVFETRLSADLAQEIFGNYDLIVDATDNFTARYCINDVAAAVGRPLVHGSVYRFSGQVGLFDSANGPCYRCLYPARPPKELAPSCAEGGVLGIVPGTIGLLMAAEAIKYLLGIGDLNAGKITHYDALVSSFMTLNFVPDPECKACGHIPKSCAVSRVQA